MSSNNGGGVVDPIRPYRGVRVQLTESDDERENHNHTQEDEYQSFVTNNNNNSNNSRFQSLRQFFSWNRSSNNSNNTDNNNNNNSTTTPVATATDEPEEIEARSPFPFSNLNMNLRRRILVFTIISILFIITISIFFVLVAGFVKPSSSSSDSGENNSSDTSNTNSFRNILLYTLTIPNAILFGCIACCCSCLWGKRILTLCLNHNRSTLIRKLKHYMLKYGLARYEGEQDDWEGEEISERNQRLLELLQSRGMDVNSLRLMMIDRDFNANDYDTLLQLDGHHAEPRGVSENTLSRLTVYRIPPLSAVEHSNDDSELYTGVPHATNSSANNEQDSSVPYCSENLGRNLLEESCCICLSKYESGDVVCTLPTCLHKYHRDCVFQALRMRNQCPICKTAI